MRIRIPTRAGAARASSRVSSNARTRGARVHSMYRMSEYIYIYIRVWVSWFIWALVCVYSSKRRTRGCPNARVDAHGDARARVRVVFSTLVPLGAVGRRARGDARQSSTTTRDDDEEDVWRVCDVDVDVDVDVARW